MAATYGSMSGDILWVPGRTGSARANKRRRISLHGRLLSRKPSRKFCTEPSTKGSNESKPKPFWSRRVKDAMAVSDRTLPRALGNLDSFKCNVELRSGIRLIAAGEQSNYRTLQCPKRIPSEALRAATSCERSSEGAPLDQLRFSLVF
ncbi:hypothetical protein PflSS101_3580 [Pseudomonas lactis]|uniref:Uncharacterized protein n=1 Tax=Pseudomonas lactis TaxID=1615674 RepID=I4K8E3_9PSED|nr:hypothetical protein PflSS101_3580 [Pseudomonas lactis]